MKYARGFLMAWGNFTAIPCPYRKWHEEARRGMLCMLPLVGAVLGCAVAVLWALLDFIGAPAVLTGAMVTAAYFMMTGFIHIDGFMDCSDAIMSRRPDMAERQRILKDPSVGAFAVVSVGVMAMLFAASMITLGSDFFVDVACVLPAIFAVSRALASDAVMRYPVMGTSQYSDMRREGAGASAGERAVLWLTGAGSMLALYFLAYIWGGCFEGVDSGGAIFYFGSVAAAAVAEVAAGYSDRRQLGGMSGDVSGHMLVTGEAAGVLAAALLYVVCR